MSRRRLQATTLSLATAKAGCTRLSLAIRARSSCAQRLTPHSEKHRTVRPSGAHSAFTNPSDPASILALHVSSRSLNTLTTPVFAHAPRTYSESHDHPAWVIHAFEPLSPDLSRNDDGPALVTFDRAAEVGEGVESTSQVRAIWKESERRMMRRSWTAVRRK